MGERWENSSDFNILIWQIFERMEKLILIAD